MSYGYDTNGDGYNDLWTEDHGRPLSPYEGMQEGWSRDFYTGHPNPDFGLIPWGTAPEEEAYYDSPIGPEPQFGEEYIYDDSPYIYDDSPYVDPWAYQPSNSDPDWIGDEWGSPDQVYDTSDAALSDTTDSSYYASPPPLNQIVPYEDPEVIELDTPPGGWDVYYTGNYPTYEDFYANASAPMDEGSFGWDDYDDTAFQDQLNDLTMDDPSSPLEGIDSGILGGLVLGKHKKRWQHLSDVWPSGALANLANLVVV